MKTNKPTGRGARRVVLSSLASLGLLMTASVVQAESGYLNTWSSLYPGSASDNNSSCKICHAASNANVNPYGRAFCQASGSTAARIRAAENANSDGDPTGSSNIEEINASAQPGWTTAAVPTYSRGSCNPTGNTERAPSSVTGLLDPSVAPAPEICDNGRDDNGDGLVDCEDFACDGAVVGSASCGIGACSATGNLVCQNGREVDTCTPSAPRAEGPFGSASCNDGIDNNCDGLADANDPNCAVPAEICDNGIDDNLDGATDCADPQCDGFVDAATACGIGACSATGSLVCQNGGQADTCQPGTPEGEGPFGDASCGDGSDNDCDGLTDAADPDCEAPPEVCDNGLDDNGNGLVDCADPQCDGFVDGACETGLPGICAAGTSVCQNGGQVCEQNDPAGAEGPVNDATCSDGLDNNCNGLADEQEPNCAPVPEVCDDGIDNSGNGLVDCQDPVCDGFVGGACDTGNEGACSAGTSACREGQQFCDQNQQADAEGPFDSPTCRDGQDNDCDGLSDMADPDCESPPEVCDNGADDNANGLVDCEDAQCDGVSFGACDTGNAGVCSAGTLTCDGSASGSVCTQDQAAGTEGPSGSPTCGDGMDNDCDGLTDADDPNCAVAAPADGDVFLTGLRVPRGASIDTGRALRGEVRATGRSTVRQNATVALSAVASANLGVTVEPASVTERVGTRRARSFEFDVRVSCNAAGRGTVNWTATISAPGNDDPSNDVRTGTTAVECRGGDDDDSDDDDSED